MPSIPSFIVFRPSSVFNAVRLPRKKEGKIGGNNCDKNKVMDVYLSIRDVLYFPLVFPLPAF